MFYNLAQLASAGFVLLPVVMLVDRRLSPGALHTWLLLRSLAGEAAISPALERSEICRLAGIQRTTLHRHLKKLTSLGYLQVHSIGRRELSASFPPLLVDPAVFQKNNLPTSLKDSLLNLDEYRERLMRGAQGSKNNTPASTNPVDMYRELTHLTPNAEQRQQIEDRVTELGVWQSTVQHWLLHGWNRLNLAGMLELYGRGGADGCRHCAKRSAFEEASAILDRLAGEQPDGDA